MNNIYFYLYCMYQDDDSDNSYTPRVMDSQYLRSSFPIDVLNVISKSHRYCQFSHFSGHCFYFSV